MIGRLRYSEATSLSTLLHSRSHERHLEGKSEHAPVRCSKQVM